MNNINLWINKISCNLQRYENVVQNLYTIAIAYNQNKKIFAIRPNLLDFPHGIGLRKIPFLKNWPTKKIISFIYNGKLKEKFTNFQKWDLQKNRSLLNQIKAKLLVWEYYLAFLEGNYSQTLVLQEVLYTKKLYFFRGLVWNNKNYTMIVGLNKFQGNKLYATDYCSFFTALLTSKEINEKAQNVTKISQINKIWYNTKRQHVKCY
ncbi:hypothetical protein [Mesomycoplasma flocculare]|uniref:Uncharacterized protein n=1 Tax=Mesomycoplasma flocculare ATCC 27399 TaxID=743971 RepID=A0A0A8E8R9_MESFC|nr:hypothetical protein [Mesomycoplasma flocculare]AJC50002.1 hypothetical protein MYF_02515 [Mesomycoplasma flocculare ATCC 27399]ENX50971.1 hypothetical protein MFC_00247 [Mesomycoplasma flocculare ATCC 27716]MXR13509.1 hypothetical protein [Mesomycoplasma flocculare]MXR22918.1 hypothetical protein [Mesomycoplasma flocculare]